MFARPWMARSFALLLAVVVASLCAQDQGSDEEVARLQKVAERFITVLEKNPRRGTALDKVYGFHVENGCRGQGEKANCASGETLHEGDGVEGASSPAGL